MGMKLQIWKKKKGKSTIGTRRLHFMRLVRENKFFDPCMRSYFQTPEECSEGQLAPMTNSYHGEKRRRRTVGVEWDGELKKKKIVWSHQDPNVHVWMFSTSWRWRHFVWLKTHVPRLSEADPVFPLRKQALPMGGRGPRRLALSTPRPWLNRRIKKLAEGFNVSCMWVVARNNLAQRVFRDMFPKLGDSEVPLGGRDEVGRS